ncbi:MAG: chloride channel protein [Prevotellaceae bacterium]|jgi:CIC family chloride channel protein|nr:chloride channel protein [Prevotellaceae bacterium]
MNIPHYKIYTSILSWRERHIKESQFVIVLSLVVGLGAGLAAVLLKSFIHLIQNFVVNITDNSLNYWYLGLPFVGILGGALFVKYVVKDDISHGVTKILYAISQHKAIIKVHNIWSSVVASAVTIGFGGSVGAEAPIVLTGSAIGSNLGRFFKLDQKTLMLLVGCGAAGAIGGIFKAPIAGVAFTLEVLLLDLTMTSVAPLLISAVSATAVSYLLMGQQVMFRFDTFEPFALSRIPFLLVLGVVCGLMSLYFVRGMNWLEQKFKRKIKNFYVKAIVGGIILSVLIFLFPPLYGEGYDTIAELLRGNSEQLFSQSLFFDYKNETWAIILFLGLISLLKIVASVATNGGGGTGGIFAPSLFVGCLTGFLVAFILNQIGFNIPLENFAFAGMAGLMSGVMHAPLTGAFLIAELTGGYDLFMTLIIVSVISYLTIIIFEPHSLYAMRLAQKGELLTHHKDRVVLTLMKMDSVIETDLTEIYPEMTLGELVKVMSQSNRNIFPVVDKKTRKLLGVMPVDEVRNIMFQPRLYDRFRVRKLMILPPAKIPQNMPMEKVMDIFENTHAWNLPVIDENGIYIGFVSKSKIFNSYRKVLGEFSDD